MINCTVVEVEADDQCREAKKHFEDHFKEDQSFEMPEKLENSEEQDFFKLNEAIEFDQRLKRLKNHWLN